MKRLLFNLIIHSLTLMTWAQTPFESLNFLYSIQGQYTLSGQHNDQKNLDCFGGGATGPDYWTNEVHDITGKYPALWGGDFLFHGSAQLRWDMTYEAERQWNAGAVINIMWHACPPVQGASCNWDGGILSSMSQQQWNELLTDGSNLNNIWKSRVDEIAVHLQYLEDAGVEVWWRPYHEQNQGAFWWNSQGPQNTQRLWRMMHDYMTNDLGLNNLVWVWNIQDIGGATNYWDWNPGNEYWDIMTLDIYADAYWNDEYINNMRATAGGKPIAIGECFNLPSTQYLNNNSDITFFMTWAYGLKRGLSCENTNTDEYIREVYNNPRILTRDEMPGWGNNLAPDNIVAGKAVTVSSTEPGEGNVAENINDRRYNTRWSSDYTDIEWVAVDLEYSYQLDSIRITWEAAYATTYEVQTSLDGTNWTTIQSVSGNSSLENFMVLNGEEASYIRILGLDRATEFGYSIYELEAYGRAQSTAFFGTPFSVPGIIQAEDYDLGGAGVAFNDATSGNSFSNYRTEDVDVESCEDAGGGYSIGAFDSGEWLNYSIDVAQSGDYTITLRVATEQSTAVGHLELDGLDITGALDVPNTGGWQVWEDLVIPNISLSAGEHKLTLVSDQSYFNVNYIEIANPLVLGSSIVNMDEHFAVYPNPSSDGQFYFGKELTSIRVIDAYGKVVFESAKSTQIDLATRPKGVYWLHATGISPAMLINE